MKAEHILAAANAAPPAPFVSVPIDDLARIVPEPQAYWWHDYTPAGEVTLLGAHGGTGKSFIALQLGVSVALGLPLFGAATRRGRVALFSGEDPADVLRRRLHHVCRAMGVSVAELGDRLHILDATAGDPVLYRETNAGGTRGGTSTATYDLLSEFVESNRIDVLIVDNASDTFDASENDRARVRAYMRWLAQLARPHRAVLLLAHVDKGTSRGDRSGTESYSGSTAWHNSARSRLFLSRDKDGGLLLEHQKSTHGPMREPLRLTWPKDGIPQADEPESGFLQHIRDGTNLKAVLKLIHEFTERGEHVGAATTSRTHAGKLLRGQSGFPAKLQDRELFDLLRTAERKGFIERASVRSKGRGHAVETWQVTPRGVEFARIAPTAPTCADFEVGASPEGAPTAPTSVRGVWGEGGRAQVGAPNPPDDAPPGVSGEVGAPEVGAGATP